MRLSAPYTTRRDRQASGIRTGGQARHPDRHGTVRHVGDALSLHGPGRGRREAGRRHPGPAIDPPASDTPVSSSAAPDTGPPRTQAQAQASAPQAIDDATALRVLKSNHCASCHQPERKVVGPAFRDIGRRHAGQPDAGRQLAASILGGSSRNWGPVPMPPQPHVNDRDLKIIVDWILQQH